MPLMIFLAGAIVGGVVGVVAGAMLQRRAHGSNVMESGRLAITIAVLALAVAAVALADSQRDRDHGDPVAVASATTTTTTRTSSGGSGTTTTTRSVVSGSLVTVPNVSHPPLTRKDAVAALQRAHLEAGIETLVLSNVPPGFVISQNPLPEATTTAGSTVTLVVSAAA